MLKKLTYSIISGCCSSSWQRIIQPATWRTYPVVEQSLKMANSRSQYLLAAQRYAVPSAFHQSKSEAHASKEYMHVAGQLVFSPFLAQQRLIFRSLLYNLRFMEILDVKACRKSAHAWEYYIILTKERCLYSNNVRAAVLALCKVKGLWLLSIDDMHNVTLWKELWYSDPSGLVWKARISPNCGKNYGILLLLAAYYVSHK